MVHQIQSHTVYTCFAREHNSAQLYVMYLALEMCIHMTSQYEQKQLVIHIYIHLYTKTLICS